VDTEVDLTALAIDRSGSPARLGAGHLRLVTRYLLPLAILAGFAAVAAWASRDFWQPPVPVTVVPVMPVRAERRHEGTPLFQAAGWIEPRPTPIRVPALAPGVVKHLRVVEDQAVEAGQIIAELVDEDARLTLDLSLATARLREAELAQSRANLQAAVTRFESPVHLEAPLAEAEAALAQLTTQLTNLPFELQRAEAAREFAERNYQGKSAARDAVTERVVDQARTDLASATALADELRARQQTLGAQRTALVKRCDALRKQLELKADEQQAREVAQADVAAASARLEQAQVDVATAKLQLERMTIRAPLAGRVLELVARPGAVLAPGKGHMDTHDGSTVVTLYRPEMLQMRVDVRFEDLPRVSLGQKVRIASPACPQPLAGTVLFLTSAADIQKNTLAVKVAVEAPPPVLKPEMLVQVTFLAAASPAAAVSAEQEQRLYLPAHVVHRSEAGAYAWVADQSEGVARRTPIQTGTDDQEGLIEITSGLNIASRVIASGAETLTDGTRIRITGEEIVAVGKKSEVGGQ
jgi:RND family efflux transporter MFP subunit